MQQFLSETILLEQGHPLFGKVLDLWHRDAKKTLNRDIPVVLTNRRKNAEMGAYKGISTQLSLGKVGEELALVIWYDPYEILYAQLLAELGYGDGLAEAISPRLERDEALGDEYEPVLNPDKLDFDMLVRRLLFWIIQLRGFKRMVNREPRYAELGTIVSNECWTPVMNGLLREIGEDLAPSLDDVAEDTLQGLKTMGQEPARRIDRLLNALRLWNLLAFCSPEKAAKLEAAMGPGFSGIKEMLAGVRDLAGEYRVLEPEGNLSLMEKIIHTYRLPGDWERYDDLEMLLKDIGNL